MISKKEDIVTALNTIAETFYFHPETFTTLPLISFYEIDNSEAQHADDKEIVSRLEYVIDIWSNTSTTSLTNQVNEKMQGLGFKRTKCIDMYEKDTKIRHTHLRYQAHFTI
jgi:hypothetical protein